MIKILLKLPIISRVFVIITFIFALFFIFSKSTQAIGTYNCVPVPAGYCEPETPTDCDTGCYPPSNPCPGTAPGCASSGNFCDCSSTDIFGRVTPPPGVVEYAGGALPGLRNLIDNVIKTIIVIAGIYSLFNLAIAGYSFMSAGGDPKKIADAWAKIWQTLIGLAIAVGSFTLAAIFGKLIFGEWDALIRLRVFGP
ncbi:MAG: hypothetical protein PVJ52_03100 [Candidatus Woesebacteria bacterium]|jgi:hypothetical protein